MAESPNLKLHLAERTLDKNFIDWRLEVNGPDPGSNMMILDAEIGALKEWKARHVVCSTTQPDDQATGDIWLELLP